MTAPVYAARKPPTKKYPRLKAATWTIFGCTAFIVVIVAVCIGFVKSVEYITRPGPDPVKVQQAADAKNAGFDSDWRAGKIAIRSTVFQYTQLPGIKTNVTSDPYPSKLIPALIPIGKRYYYTQYVIQDTPRYVALNNGRSCVWFQYPANYTAIHVGVANTVLQATVNSDDSGAEVCLTPPVGNWDGKLPRPAKVILWADVRPTVGPTN